MPVAAGRVITVPIQVYNLPEVSAFSFKITFDSERLEWVGIGKENTLVSPWTFLDANAVQPSQWMVAGLGTQAIHGTGTLIYIQFQVKEALTDYQSTPLILSDLDGVSHVTLEPITIDFLEGMAGDLNGDQHLTIRDVQILFDIVLGRNDPTPAQRYFGDVNIDNKITIADVQILFNRLLGKTETSAQSRHNARRIIEPAQANQLFFGEAVAGEENQFMIPVEIHATVPVVTFEFEVGFDPGKVTFVGIGKTGTLSEAMTFADAFEYAPGKIKAAGLGDKPVTGGGRLLWLRFKPIPSASGNLALTLGQLEGDMAGFTPQGRSLDLDHLQTEVRDFVLY